MGASGGWVGRQEHVSLLIPAEPPSCGPEHNVLGRLGRVGSTVRTTRRSQFCLWEARSGVRTKGNRLAFPLRRGSGGEGAGLPEGGPGSPCVSGVGSTCGGAPLTPGRLDRPPSGRAVASPCSSASAPGSEPNSPSVVQSQGIPFPLSGSCSLLPTGPRCFSPIP